MSDGTDGWDGMVIIGHRSSKSTFGAKKEDLLVGKKGINFSQEKAGYEACLNHKRQIEVLQYLPFPFG